MPQTRTRMYGFTHLFAALFVAALILWPVFVALLRAGHRPVTPDAWTLASSTAAAMAVLLVYVARRCSSPELSYWDGLLVVTQAMRTGWVYSSMLVVFPALLATFAMSLRYALAATLRRRPTEAPVRFRTWVITMHARRMRE